MYVCSTYIHTYIIFDLQICMYVYVHTYVCKLLAEKIGTAAIDFFIDANEAWREHIP